MDAFPFKSETQAEFLTWASIGKPIARAKMDLLLQFQKEHLPAAQNDLLTSQKAQMRFMRKALPILPITSHTVKVQFRSSQMYVTLHITVPVRVYCRSVKQKSTTTTQTAMIVRTDISRFTLWILNRSSSVYICIHILHGTGPDGLICIDRSAMSPLLK
jgi:hypothetical protein